MISENHPVLLSAFLGNLFTWGMAAVGALFVFVVQKPNRLLFDVCLGFSAGVMSAASFWCLLVPALDIAEESGFYEKYAFVPLAIGFMVGCLFLITADMILKHFRLSLHHDENSYSLDEKPSNKMQNEEQSAFTSISKTRMFMLVIGIAIHNIPEAMSIGVAFGAIGKTESATFENARSLAIGLGIHNIPEGLAVSLPLRSMGMARWKAFFWGQFSGVMEPIFGILGCIAVTVIEPILPYGLAFAAGAMMWVVFDDLIAEGSSSGNSKWCSLAAMVGFTLMMIMELYFHYHDHDSHGHDDHADLILNSTIIP